MNMDLEPVGPKPLRQSLAPFDDGDGLLQRRFQIEVLELVPAA